MQVALKDAKRGDMYFRYLPRQGTSVWASFSDSVTYVIQDLITFPKSNKRKS